MPTVDQPAPDFTLPDQTGQPVALASLRGQVVVLYFYPKDDTSGCTTQACGLRDAEAAFAVNGATVVGVSPDSTASHAKFATKHALNFRLLADTEKAAAELYGVWKEKSMYGKTYMGVERTTFVIDPAGLIRHIFPKVKVAGHAEAVLAAVAALR